MRCRADERDAAGLRTDYEYDQFGRLKAVKRRNAATSFFGDPVYVQQSTFAYTAATEDAKARVVETVKDGEDTSLSTTTYMFDGVGRPFKVTRSIPGGQTATVETEFDGLGRKKRVSQPSAGTPADWTSMRYDAFGRPTWIESPDGKVSTIVHAGDRVRTRRANVATSTDAEAETEVVERYDIQQRLRQVIERSGDTSAATPIGTAVTTSYGYDVGGRLTSVTMAGTPSQAARSFNYDLRGFLLSETHPESGTTTYQNHDARGHATTANTPTATLTFEYDGAERLTKVLQGSTELKSFVFATANSGTNMTKGRLETAKRRNQLVSGATIDVTETYVYASPEGMLSKRTTAVDRIDGGTVSRIQTFVYEVPEYDAFLQPKSVHMPTCVDNGCSAAGGLATVGYGRDAGYLTSVGSLASLTYHPSGMVKTVTHLPGETQDVYEAEKGLGRPSLIRFEGASTCPKPVITAAGSACPSGTNDASVEGSAAYSWSITGGTFTSGNTGPLVTFQPSTGSTSVTLTVVATSSCGTTRTIKTIAVGATAAPTITAPDSVCGDSQRNKASVPARPGITHSWTIGGGTITSASTDEIIEFQPNAGSTSVTLTVTASGSCGSAASLPKSVSVADNPSAVLTPNEPNPTIVRGSGARVQLLVTAGGASPRHIVWSDGYTTDMSSPLQSRFVSPSQTTTYSLVSVTAGSCVGTVEGEVTVTVVPASVPWVTATTLSNRNVYVTWPAMPGATGYRVERATQVNGVASWSTDVQAGSTSFTDTVPATTDPVTYIYYVLAKDEYGAFSGRAGFDFATAATTLWTDPVITPGVTVIRGAYIQELRKAVDAFRQAFNVGPAFAGSTSPTGMITTTYFTTLVTKLNEARQPTYPAFAYANVPLPQPRVIIRAGHIQQLRDALH